MKQLLHVAILACALVLMVAPQRAHADVNDFRVTRFEADYYLSRDAQNLSRLRVVEQIEADFPNADQNHGILRALPQSYQNHPTSLRVESVKNAAGQNWPYRSSTSNGNLVLKIGDADRYVHGRQVYIITYSEVNVTTAAGSYDGHFWDTNGDGWSQVFDHVTAHVHVAPDLAAQLQPAHTRCFTGPRGSTASDCRIQTVGATGGQIDFIATRPLGPGENLTYELGFAPGTFAPYTMPRDELIRIVALVLGLGVAPPVLALVYVIRRWRKEGRDATDTGTIVAEYLPPKDLSTLASSLVLQEHFEPRAISAQIIDLAVRGYLKIYEIEKQGLFKGKSAYEVELVQTDDNLRREERDVIELLFGRGPLSGSRVNLNDLANKLHQGATTLGKQVSQQLADTGSFRAAPHKAGQNLLIAGIILIIAGVIGTATTTGRYSPGLYCLGIVLSGAILAFASRIMPARTRQGVAQYRYLLGLKLYVTMAEADRLRVLQSPHGELTETIDTTDTSKLIKLYEHLLPYAMLFGLEKDWAKEFAPLYQQPPDWYSGNAASFSAGHFAGSLHSFAATSTASFTAPSSSGSGGSSGGGGGGGGGGGW